jgi:hypothetical protein
MKTMYFILFPVFIIVSALNKSNVVAARNDGMALDAVESPIPTHRTGNFRQAARKDIMDAIQLLKRLL